MPLRTNVFLTAEWRHLALLKFDVEPALLLPRVPRGVELDLWEGRAIVSVVGLLFENTRVLGWGLPRHRNFEEVNLRFYVRRRADDGWRRGVVFVKEFVPRAAVTLVARRIYNENYWAVPMTHRVDGGSADGARRVSYSWTVHSREQRLDLAATGEPHLAEPGSEAEFTTEHYWGYTRQRDGGTLEYRVEHPRWKLWPAKEARFVCDAAAVYGPEFAAPLSRQPASAWLAEGSEVRVYQGLSLGAAIGAVR